MRIHTSTFWDISVDTGVACPSSISRDCPTAFCTLHPNKLSWDVSISIWPCLSGKHASLIVTSTCRIRKILSYHTCCNGKMIRMLIYYETQVAQMTSSTVLYWYHYQLQNTFSQGQFWKNIFFVLHGVVMLLVLLVPELGCIPYFSLVNHEAWYMSLVRDFFFKKKRHTSSTHPYYTCHVCGKSVKHLSLLVI